MKLSIKQLTTALFIATGVALTNFCYMSKAYAKQGGQDGGGGAAIVCRNEAGQISSARLYDLYAIENNPRSPRETVKSNASIEQLLQQALNRVASAHSENGTPVVKSDNLTVSLISRALALVQRDWIPLLPGTRLDFVPDVAAEFVSSRPECKLETVAHYDDQLSNLSVDMQIYNQFSETDKAALKMHEALYKISRILFADTTSKRTRGLVGELFAKVTLMNSVLTCIWVQKVLNAVMSKIIKKLCDLNFYEMTVLNP
jgi:hypothetical protein